ncbi:DUF92 domain-containing protein [Pedobacter rhizosphaerae]|uniref:TIGR00297 family protein n=1 Tax=Pedobacter rhizosphaerae TaxID=390241 RepID=A0A1H9TXD7_9SPHI|nr:DUF92 domain-containing protein [Pedobacter rhizosphaerae]SES01577.1 TIGR00297 family protein [Pedobacter rhizosphaerae]
MFNSDILLPIIIISGIAYSILAKKLTVLAALTGGVLASLIFIGAGYTGVAMMTTFFILGSAATSWKQQDKQGFTVGEETKNGRSALQVLANAGAAAMGCVVIIFYPELGHFMLPAMAAAFASATADTLSSELGTVYGKRFLNIVTFKPDRCGQDGVVSLEGTLIGIAGSSILAIIYVLGYGWNINFFLIIIAGTLGNLTDSLLGAFLERKGIIGNNLVNFLSTVAASLVALLLDALF